MARLTKLELECVIVAAIGVDQSIFDEGTKKRDVARADKKRAALKTGLSKLRDSLKARSGASDSGETEE